MHRDRHAITRKLMQMFWSDYNSRLTAEEEIVQSVYCWALNSDGGSACVYSFGMSALPDVGKSWQFLSLRITSIASGSASSSLHETSLCSLLHSVNLRCCQLVLEKNFKHIQMSWPRICGSCPFLAEFNKAPQTAGSEPQRRWRVQTRKPQPFQTMAEYSDREADWEVTRICMYRTWPTVCTMYMHM